MASIKCAYLACWPVALMLLWGPPITAQADDFQIDSAWSREVSAAVGWDPYAVTSAWSREVSAAVGWNPSAVTSAWSREVSVSVIIPKIAEIADAVVPEGIPYAGPTPELIVPDTEATWSLVTGPAGMDIDPATGVVSWDSPTLAGSPHTITIEAETRGSIAQASWLLTVITSPEIAEIPDQAIPGGTAQYTGSIPELLKGTPPITWSLATGPEGMTINPGDGVLSWSDPTEAGSPHTITVRACNDTCDPPICCDEETWRLTVQTAPVIADIPDETIEELLPYTGPTPELLQAIGPVSWSLVSGPQEMIIDPQTGVVSWLRPLGSLTPYVVTIQVTDATGSDTETWRLTVPISYTAMVSASPNAAPAGTPILLQGTATKLGSGDPASNARVFIRVRVQGTRRVITSLSDAAGKFQAIFYPLANEAGVYEVGADHPGVTTDKTDDVFTLYGMQCVPATKTEKLIPGELPKTTEVSLRNLGDTSLTGLQAFVEEAAPNLSVQTQVPVELPAHGQSWLRYTVVAMDATVENSTFVIRVTSAEGAVAVLNVNAQVSPLVPHLVANPASVQAAMLRGTQTLVQFEVTNDGGVASQAVSVQIPNVPWMTLATPSTLDSLAPGEKTGVVLNLAPDADLPLGPYQGMIIVSTNLSSVTVPFHFEAMSDRKGDLRVRVTDEYTYWASGNPRVANAVVTVKNGSGEHIATATTDDSGVVLFSQLTEAYYTVEVSAPDHGGFSTQVLVAAAQVKEMEAFLPRQLVTYNWTVVPTQVRDEYTIGIKAVFETHVPAPVITIDPPLVDLTTLGCEEQINFTITNHGLIAAEAGEMLFSDNNSRWEITPLVQTLGVVPPQSSMIVPVRIRNKTCPGYNESANTMVTAAMTAKKLTTSEPDPCAGPELKLKYELVCGIPVAYYVPVGFKTPPASCGGGGVRWGGGGGGGLGGGGGGWGGGPTIRLPVPDVRVFCDNCYFQALVNCGLGSYKLPGCIFSLASTGVLCASCADAPNGDFCMMECVLSGTTTLIGCIIPSWQLSFLFCFKTSALVCAVAPGSALGPAPAAVLSMYEPAIAYPVGDGSPWTTDGATVPNLSVAMQELLNEVERLQPVFDLYLLFYGSEKWLLIPADQDTAYMAIHNACAAAFDPASEAGHRVSDAERAVIAAVAPPSNMTTEDIEQFLDRWNRTADYYGQGIITTSQVPPGSSTDFIDYDLFVDAVNRLHELNDASNAAGHASLLDPALNAIRTAEQAARNPEEGICARVRIRVDQHAVISRSGFLAALDLENAGTSPLQEIGVTLDIRESDGRPSNDRFGIYPPVLTNLSDVSGGGIVNGGASGRAEWTLVPSNLAAPTAPVTYFVGGTLTYVLDGQLVTIPLFPAEITVVPNPSLHLKYFLEKTVYSDDPFTPEVESAVPFSLGLLMQNTGAGLASNVRITSAQPKIIENDESLLIDFVIIGTTVGARSYSPSLTAVLGDLGPGQSEVAQWLMTSSLQGQFIEYSATFEHVNGLNNPQLSIMDSVTIHEMIHVVRVDQPTDDGKPDFLVNDVIDPDTLPDTLHASTGDVWPVTAVTDGTISGEVSADRLEVQLTATLPPGWSYLRVDNPASPEFRLAKVLRPDGSEVRIGDNAWTTRRTVRLEGESPREESLLHLLDHNSPGAYTLIYAPTRPPSKADLDGNGTVDGVDWGLFLAALGRSQGTPGYNPAADLDSDGTVTFVDQQLWMAAFRQFIGDPNAIAPVPITLPAYLGDLDGDGDVDAADFGVLQQCYSGRGVSQRTPGCEVARIDGDLDVDLDDLTKLIDCANGPAIPPPDRCRR